MFNNILINPKTATELKLFIKAPKHALLLAGPDGSNKVMIAKQLAAELLALESSRLDSYPHYGLHEKLPDKQEFTIDIVRQINKSLALKTPGKRQIRRVIIVKDAHTMNQEAQNAFLKTLEEPPEDTVFILTTNSRKGVLPTILSRTMPVDVARVDLAAGKKFYKDWDAREVESAWQLSQGLPGLLHSLLTESGTDLREATKRAKDFLKMPRLERMIELSKISKDKDDFKRLLEGLSRVIRALYQISAKSGNSGQTDRLLRSMKLVLESQEALQKNGLPKLIAIRLGLNLSI